jgi:hypothetical protein
VGRFWWGQWCRQMCGPKRLITCSRCSQQVAPGADYWRAGINICRPVLCTLCFEPAMDPNQIPGWRKRKASIWHKNWILRRRLWSTNECDECGINVADVGWYWSSYYKYPVGRGTYYTPTTLCPECFGLQYHTYPPDWKPPEGDVNQSEELRDALRLLFYES